MEQKRTVVLEVKRLKTLKIILSLMLEQLLNPVIENSFWFIFFLLNVMTIVKLNMSSSWWVFPSYAGRSSKAKKKRKKEQNFVQKIQESPEKGGHPDLDDIYNISSGDEDCSKGMKSMRCLIEVFIVHLINFSKYSDKDNCLDG